MKWGDMIENYLHTSRSLKLVFLLIDIRHNPGENDRNMFEWIIYQGFTPVIIATKSDKLKPSQIESHVQMLRDELHMDDAIKVIPFSSVSKDGLQEIYDIMDALVDEYYEDNDFDDESTPKLKDGKVAKGPRKKGKKKWENPDGTSNDKRLLPPKEDKKGSEKSARSSSRKTSSNAKTNADKKSQQNAQGSNHASTRTSAKSNTSYKKTSSKAADKAPQKKKKRTIRNVHSKKN